MEFSKVIKKRRSVRRYTDKVVPDSVVETALDHALLAPNSSNMQPWEFYWVKSESKKALLVEACLNQSAAKTAQHLIVAVARRDTWDRNRKLIITELKKQQANEKVLTYYEKLIPFVYRQGPFSLFGGIKSLGLNVAGIFQPLPRGPNSYQALFEVLVKTTALACENFMLSIVDQGYGCCPMEGFDETRVKSILNLNRKTHVVMAISVGEVDPEGIWGDQIRLDKNLFIHRI